MLSISSGFWNIFPLMETHYYTEWISLIHIFMDTNNSAFIENLLLNLNTIESFQHPPQRSTEPHL